VPDDLDPVDAAERAAFLRQVGEDAARLSAATAGVGAYANAGADPAVVADLAASLRAVDPFDDLVEAILGATPGKTLDGVDWSALGLAGTPGYIAPDDPVLCALRELEPPLPRAWRRRARAAQLPPAGVTWMFWLILAGRGFGKTWTGANVLAEWAVNEPGDYALVAPTFGDARKICVEEPESGLLAALGDDLLNYNKSDYVIYVRGGSRIVLASADTPDRLRGYNFRAAWLDELASYPNIQELWDESLLPAVRKGRQPRFIITTTPRRGNPVLKELLRRAEDGDPDVVVTRGRTADNLANLSARFVEAIYKRYKGTKTGRQELDGELLDDVDGALVSSALVEATRIRVADVVPVLRRIVVGVDPAVTSKKTSDRCGIVVVGIGPAPKGMPGIVRGDHLYVLEDATVRGTPEHWARRALEVAEEWGADAIAAETNNGGELVTTMVRMVARAEGLRVPRIIGVWAARGKLTRAEPVAGVWEQGRVHCVGAFPEYEDCWTGWVPGAEESPDPLDAGVWASVQLMPELSIKGGGESRIIA
jgi:phage terminase large subunit-like protein